MNPMTHPPEDLPAKIRALIANCENAEPPFSSLGTPFVGQEEATQEILELGATAVEPLLELLPTAGPHAAACIAFCLGQLGDRRAVRPLQQALSWYEAKTLKGSFDFAFIGNARAALAQLGR
jgi:hypothetical protein